MELTPSTAQHDIKVEIKEEVLDIYEATQYSCEESLQTKEEDDSINDFEYLNVNHAEEESDSLRAHLRKTDGDLYGLTCHQQSHDVVSVHSSVTRTALQIPGKFQARKAQYDEISIISPPCTLTHGWCTTKVSKLIVQFLEDFAKISRSSRYTYSANYNIACNGPRFLQCEKCSLLFSGLHDRYLKLFLHYKTCHKKTCNLLIGQKWVRHKNIIQNMIRCWQRDTYK